MGLLADCHRRIERFLTVLVRVVGTAKGGPLNEDQRLAMETALSYFREAAPKHTEDEEASLFPRLRLLERPEVKTALAKVDMLQRQHLEMEKGHAEVDRLGWKWLGSGTLPAADAQRLSEVLSTLEQLHRDHIEVEERDMMAKQRRLNRI